MEAKIFAGDNNPKLENYAETIQFMARARPHFMKDRDAATGKNDLVSVLEKADIAIPLKSLVDVDKEKARLNKEITALEADVERLKSRLGDENFLGKAPTAVVEKEKNNLKSRQEKLAKLQAELGRL